MSGWLSRAEVGLRDLFLASDVPGWIVRLYWRVVSQLPVPLWARITLSAALPASLAGGWVGVRRLARGRDERSAGIRLGPPGSVERPHGLEPSSAKNEQAAAHSVYTAPAAPQRTDDPARP